LLTAQKTSEEIRLAYNVSSEAFKVDVSDPDQVLKLKDDIKEKKFDEVDILVNNAGILAPLSIFDGTNSDIQRIINVNLTSHFWVNFF
jgi:NAD(P)-dependent dehydrogenase (short-subunit alcohol dehydrogenase family)